MVPSHSRSAKPGLCHFFQYRQCTALLSRRDPPALVEGTKLHVRGSLAAWRKRENLSPSHNSPYESVPRQAISFCCKARVISHCERRGIKLVGLTTRDSLCFFTFKKKKKQKVDLARVPPQDVAHPSASSTRCGAVRSHEQQHQGSA